ncbi:PREDICTED: PIH1 domain-containing protein 2 [Nanorana parkeri]|uniref:PIH1 domain-containing protein 2 n=1 Tax=Nanorana parkeri TaxID=125878 RepID=UPI0008544279|nr:PREDICTED: PIH1 domain-containing protein 2 [Nanorana parkeri]
MNSKVTPNELLSQVNQFWSMLDDMAENSPDSYQKFIQRHMKEGKDFMEPPEPFLCVQTKILYPEERMLFINICGWKKVPAPQSDLHPMPLIAGKLEDTSEGTVFDIAYSTEVLKRAESDRVEQDQLIRLAMKYIEQQHKVTLCHSYHIAPIRQKGNLHTLRKNLQGKQEKPTKIKAKSEKAPDRSLLEQIKNISMKEEEKEEVSPHIEILEESNLKPSKASLIEVISSTELAEEDLIPTPHHELSVINNLSGTPQKIILRAALHGVRSVSDCELSVSKDDLMVEVPGKYRLHLDLPVLVNEDSATATYNKVNGTLTVTVSVAENQGV